MALTDLGDLHAALAVTRFGLGARPGEIEAATADPKGFLKAQIRRQGADQPQGALSSTAENIAVFQALRRERKDLRAEAARQDRASQTPADERAAAELKQAGQEIREIAVAEMAARARLATATPSAFRERWALFWANHFTVSATKGAVAPIAGSFEREAVRPHVFGRFADMLQASSHHPAMLLYLDQTASAGPDSMAGRRRGVGLNENLAREIMELHTVGVNAGYAQGDVTEFARALTGWSVARAEEGRLSDAGGASAPGTFLFRPNLHEPGARTVLGRSYPDGGETQARAILDDLAAHPATAAHIARKVAVHFVADDPAPALVQRLERSFRVSGGRLDVLAAALIDSPEAWEPAAAKFKSPYEFVVSAWRAAGATPDGEPARHLVGSLAALGQKPFSPPSPKGWPDSNAEWAAPDALIKRIAWSEAAGKALPSDADPNQMARQALGARLSPETAAAIARAETRPEAFAVLLMSPEFQRR